MTPLDWHQVKDITWGLPSSSVPRLLKRMDPETWNLLICHFVKQLEGCLKRWVECLMSRKDKHWSPLFSGRFSSRSPLLIGLASPLVVGGPPRVLENPNTAPNLTIRWMSGVCSQGRPWCAKFESSAPHWHQARTQTTTPTCVSPLSRFHRPPSLLPCNTPEAQLSVPLFHPYTARWKVSKLRSLQPACQQSIPNSGL